MSGKLGRILAQEFVSGVVWLYVLRMLGKVTLAPLQQVWISLAAGLAAGTVLAVVGVWMAAPIRRAAGWAIAARIAVWVAVLAMAAAFAVLGWPGVAAGLVAAATAVFGIPIARQIREVRAGRPHLPTQPGGTHDHYRQAAAMALVRQRPRPDR